MTVTVAGNWGLSSAKVLEIVGAKDIEGTIMGQALDLDAPKAQAFDAQARKEYGSDYRWPVVAALGYDAGRIAFGAIDKAGSDPDAIRVRWRRLPTSRPSPRPRQRRSRRLLRCRLDGE